jgi:hypothetical protein
MAVSLQSWSTHFEFLTELKVSMVERRRSVRVNVSPARPVPVAISMPAQVIEINVSGVLLKSKTEVPRGERGALRATLGDRALDVAVEIRDVAEETRSRGGPHYRLGAAFVDVAAEQRLLLLELLGVERH